MRGLPFYIWLVLLFAAIYGLWFLVVSPRGEFPLNDDWAYARSAQYLLDTGQLRISQWAAAAVVFQTYWGALFAQLLGGFSFTALRVSTLAFSFISGLALYALLRQLELSNRTATLGALALIANPLFVYLSYTFMSDIFYLGLMLLSLTFYLRGLKQFSGGSLLAGSVFAAGAYLSRQLGLALPLAVMAALVIREKRLPWREIFMAELIPCGTILGHTLWLQYVHGVPWGFALNAVQNSARIMLQPIAPVIIAQRLLLSLLYMGLFALPASIAQSFSLAALPKRRLIRLGKLYGIWIVALGLFVFLQVLLTRRPMPYLSNVINMEGIGLLALNGHKIPVTPAWVFWLVTAIAPFAGAAQGALWTEALLDLRREAHSPVFTLVIVSLLMAIPIAASVVLWDEYLLVFVPLGLYLTLRLRPVSRRGVLLGICVCAAFMGYSLIEMDDHFAWNSARWEAGQALVAQGVHPENIEGGLEWDGWYAFETAWPQAMAQGKRNDLWAWMTITPHQYWLAFESLPGYTVVRQTPYSGRLSRQTKYIYTLKPNTPNTP